MNETKRKSGMIALCGLMGALSMVIMLLGGIIPIGTYACPALAALVLIPVISEYGHGAGAALYVVISALCLLLAPDKESAVIFTFVGWYPAARDGFNKIKPRLLRVLAKFLAFNAAIGLAYWLMLTVFNMAELVQEYHEFSMWLLIVMIALGNATFFVYDFALVQLTLAYNHILRPKLRKGH